MNEDILTYFIIILVVGLALKTYMDSDAFNLKCIISTVDGNKYCVRERNKIQLVADLLARVTNKLKQLVEHLKQTYPDRDNVKRLVENFNPKRITETLPTSTHTAYSENKGEKMAFCVTEKKNGTKLIDENTLTFVAIHEISHVGTKSIGHNDEFWNNFKFLLNEAKKIGIYQPEDYKKKNKEYCGMKLTDNPYFDM
jgi:predicted metal-dependent hydrolase